MFIKRNSENFKPATPDEFYAKLTDYKEFENATLNVRKVTKYGDVKNCIEDLGNYKRGNLELTFKNLRKDINQDRNIYLYISVLDNKSEIKKEFRIYDSETGILIQGGNSKTLKKATKNNSKQYTREANSMKKTSMKAMSEP